MNSEVAEFSKVQIICTLQCSKAIWVCSVLIESEIIGVCHYIKSMVVSTKTTIKVRQCSLYFFHSHNIWQYADIVIEDLHWSLHLSYLRLVQPTVWYMMCILIHKPCALLHDGDILRESRL